jgi:hypothetical protein
VFESLKARLDRLLQVHSRSDHRARAAALREALLEAKVGVSTMRSALMITERELESERRQLADAERRGRLAAEVPDPETVGVAEREVVEMLGEYRGARQGPASESIDAAWRDLEAAGGERPGLGLDTDPAETNSEEKLKQAVDAQLAYLKKKLGKEK